MTGIKKAKSISFSDLCGNDAPVIRFGAQAVKVKELTDNSLNPDENNFDHTRAGTFKFRDPDVSDHHTAKVTALGSGFLGDFKLGPVNQGANAVGWSFTVADSVLDHLQEGETLVQRYKVTINDGHGGKDSEIVTVTICGTEDKPLIPYFEGEGEVSKSNIVHDTFGFVSEDTNVNPNGFLVDDGSFTFTDVDLKDFHTLSIAPDANNTVGGTLTAVVSNASTGDGVGEIHWTYSLDNALAQPLTSQDFKLEYFNITIDDHHGGTVVQQIAIGISGQDEIIAKCCSYDDWYPS